VSESNNINKKKSSNDDIKGKDPDNTSVEEDNNSESIIIDVKDKNPSSASSSSSSSKKNSNKEESTLEIIPITLNEDNDKFEINDDNEQKQAPLESIIEENEDDEESDIMSYSSEDEKDIKEAEPKKLYPPKKSNSNNSIPKIVISNEMLNQDKSEKPLTPSPDTDVEENIEENIEEEYLTDDFEDDVENENKENETTRTEEDKSSSSKQNNNKIEITIESATFNNDPNVQELLSDVKECFIAYEFLNYEPQDLTSEYSILNNNKMIFHFSKQFDINESDTEKMDLFRNMLDENDFQISIFKPPDESGISNELAFAEWDWKELIENGHDIQNKEIILYDPNQTIEMGKMTISFSGINVLNNI